MKRRRILSVSVGMLVFGGLLLASGGPGVTPAGAQNPTQQQHFRQIMDKLDQVLAAIKSNERSSVKSGEGNEMVRWDQVLPAEQRFVVLPAFKATRCWIKKPALFGKSPRRRPRSPRQTSV